MTGRHQCGCGSWVSNNALARASHRRSHRCFLESYWRGLGGKGAMWYRLKIGKATVQDAGIAVIDAEQLAHAGRALLRQR